jgi:hypothetical protein
MQTLQYIDTLTDEVLTEMLELISLDYNTNFYECLSEVIYTDLLTEALTPEEIRNQQREKRIRTAALRAAKTPTSRSTQRYNRQQSDTQVNQTMKGKYDRRPWYKRAFNGLKNWVKGKLTPNNQSSDETSNEPVTYVRRTSNSSDSNTRRTTNNTTQTNNNQNSSDTTPVKITSSKQPLANKLRNERLKTRENKLKTFNKFKQNAQAAKFKQMPKPLSPSALANKTSSNTNINTTQSSSDTPAPRYPLGVNVSRPRPKIPRSSLATSMRPEE